MLENADEETTQGRQRAENEDKPIFGESPYDES